MTRRLYETLARFCGGLAVSDEPLDIGQFGPPAEYSPFERCRIGPMVGSMARRGLLVPGGGGNSERATRNGAFSRKWLATSSNACRAQSEVYWRLAESVDDNGERLTGPKQLRLFS